jgi:hypothetical protein
MIQISKRKFYFYLIIVIGLILASYYSGYKFGRLIEEEEWLELVNRPECECLKV